MVADSGARSLEEIEALEPDVIFLDLKMPQVGGREFIQRLQGGAHLPVIVVVTACDQYAIKALDDGAIDYLLKPVAAPRPLRSLERALQLLGSRPAAA